MSAQVPGVSGGERVSAGASDPTKVKTMAAPPSRFGNGGRMRAAGFEWALLAVPGLLWGASLFFIALALEVFAPPVLTFLALILAVSALLLVRGGRKAFTNASTGTQSAEMNPVPANANSDQNERIPAGMTSEREWQ